MVTQVSCARGNSLARNIIWTFAGNVVYGLCQWGVLVILAKLTSAEGVGRFALALAITGPLFAITNLNLRAVQATDARGETPFATYFGLRLLSSSLAVAATWFIAIAFVGATTGAAIVGVFGVAKFFESLSDCIYGYMQWRERMKWIAQSMMVRGTVSLVILTIFVWMTGSVLGATIGYVVSWVCVFFFLDMPRARKVQRLETAFSSFAPSFQWTPLKALLFLALPLGVVMFLSSLSMNIPLYVIAAELGEAPLGYFAATVAFIVVGATAVNALAQASVPRLARYYLDLPRAYASLLLRMMAAAAAIGLAGILVAWLFGGWILKTFYAPSYGAYADVLVWVMVAALLLYLAATMGSGLTAARRFRVQTIMTSISTAVVSGAALMLIPEYGLIGGALALCFGFACKLGAQSVVVITLLRTSRPIL